MLFSSSVFFFFYKQCDVCFPFAVMRGVFSHETLQLFKIYKYILQLIAL